MKFPLVLGAKCAAAALFLFISFSVMAVPGDEHWDVQFGWAGPGPTVPSITPHNGQLYVGGTGNGTTNAVIRVWDGRQWQVFAQFFGTNTGVAIFDIAFVGDTLYAGGAFTNVNGVGVNGLAKWDGTNWSNVNNFVGTVTGLTVDGARLYVSGIFTNPAVGGVMATNIAYWDGANWNAMGNGLGYVSGTGYGVHSTAVQNGLVYAVGLFTNSGPQFITNVAVWDGNTWSGVGGGVNNLAETITFNGNDLYVFGAFTQAGTTTASLGARWDGTSWHALGSGLSGSLVYSCATLNGLVYAAGLFATAGGVHATNIAVWNGSTWAPLGVGFNSNGNGTRLFSTATNVLVGGNFLSAGNMIANALASWDGAAWNVLGTPGRINGVSSTVRAFAGDATNLYVGGSFAQMGQTNGNLVAHFDGANWSPLGIGVGGGTLPVVYALAATSSNVYVGGAFIVAGGNVPAANIAQWDGANWSALGNGPGGQVGAITVRTDGVYAAGAPFGASGYSGPFFQRWDGTNWQSVLIYNPDDTLGLFYLNDSNMGMDAMAFDDTNIYVGGHFILTWHDATFSTGISCSNIMRFDGTYARVMGSGLNSNVVAMTMLGTNLYVAGLFTNAGGVMARHIAMWDGNAWWPVGAGVVGNGTVDTLTTIGTNLYAGGTFTNMGGVPASRIAKWDGNTWSALGSGVSATVLALYSSGSNLYVGGSLRAAGNLPSQFIGIWNDQVSFKTPQLVNPAWMGNGQFRARVLSVSGTTNVVEATSDFSSWTPVMTNSVGDFDVTDAAAGNSARRFYRARLVP